MNLKKQEQSDFYFYTIGEKKFFEDFKKNNPEEYKNFIKSRNKKTKKKIIKDVDIELIKINYRSRKTKHYLLLSSFENKEIDAVFYNFCLKNSNFYLEFSDLNNSGNFKRFSNNKIEITNLFNEIKERFNNFEKITTNIVFSKIQNNSYKLNFLKKIKTII